MQNGLRSVRKKQSFRVTRKPVDFKPYASVGAPTGQVSAQAPHDVHFFWSITYFPLPSEMHDTGHSASQAAQEMHSSLIK
jgi:hypothetical protein